MRGSQSSICNARQWKSGGSGKACYADATQTQRHTRRHRDTQTQRHADTSRHTHTHAHTHTQTHTQIEGCRWPQPVSRRTLLNGLNFCRHISSAICRIMDEPEPLSLMPGPASTESRCDLLRSREQRRMRRSVCVCVCVCICVFVCVCICVFVCVCG